MRIWVYVSFFLLFVFLTSQPVFSATQTTEYLCETGINFYRAGRLDDALMEFKKALMMDPANQTAKSYINNIFKEGMPPLPAKEKIVTAQAQSVPQMILPALQVPSAPIGEKPILKEEPIKEPVKKYSREEMMNRTLDGLSNKKEVVSEKPAQMEVAGIKITGETQARLGVASQDTYWKRANWDLNEKNFRVISNTALDRRENTFDPRIYDRLEVNLDTDKEEGLGFHSNITVDPWSFTGKSSKITVNSAFGDTADIELKYWSNTGYTINETINSNLLGNSFSLPEIKVRNERTDAFNISGAFTPNDTFQVPEMKIYREFQPVRELWFDYKQDGMNLKFFPIAYENQALTFDDPLKLSNNRIWWEDSPWIHGWTPGNFNSGPGANDFNKGYWDNTLSFFTRDSEGQRLTALRGFSFEFNPQDQTSIMASVASPKTLWQDYSNIDNLLSAARLKQSLLENLNLGLTATTRFGYNTDDKWRLDARNFVFGTDMSYEITNGIMATFEVARSQSKYDLTSSQFQTESRGNAYHFSILGRFPSENIINTEYGYNGIQPEDYETSFTKFRFFASRMDESFDASLSSYAETRDDEFWSRHLHFREPFKHYYQGEGQLLSWDDIKGYSIGNGIDIGRSVLGFRIESLLWDKVLANLFDVRNVHATDNKFIENVSREELTWNINDKLTTKLLGIYHRLPKTKAGFDPFIFDSRSRRFFTNDQIEDGKNPSITTGSLGLEYEFFDWLTLNGIWEYTNDISLGYDNFPRGILNGGNRSFIFYENDNKYRDVLNFLYGQQYFPKPPYPYYNIFKTGLKFSPMNNLEFYLDYTRNAYEKAGQVDDNMNHVGFEIAYTPMSKLALFFKYTYSRWQDLDSISQGITKVWGHHNLFSELIYRKSADEDISFQYGEASRDPYMGGVLDIGWDPFGGSLRTIDTQHIFRMYYRRKF